MGRELTPAELDELLGAYALDAVDGDEREQIEAWLARTPDAQRDVDELRETASLLTYASDDEIPDGLWTRIEDQLSAPPPPLRLVAVTPGQSDDAAPPDRRARRPWLWGIAAALALVLAVSVGVVAVQRNSDQDARLDAISARMEHEQMREAAFDAAMQPQSRVAELAAANGSVKAKVVTTADGRGYFMRDQLPALPSGRTYQLWALMDNATNPTMISVGVLGRESVGERIHRGRRSHGLRRHRGSRPRRGFHHTTDDAEGHVGVAPCATTSGARLASWLTSSTHRPKTAPTSRIRCWRRRPTPVLREATTL